MSKQAISITLGALLASGMLVVAVGMFSGRLHAEEVMVFKSPTCGCCEKWVDHLREHGFTVRTRDVANLNQIKLDNGITPETASCHTAFVGNYVVEGHVPADAIRRLLAERPDVKGITVPGMPVGSPGMEQGDRKVPYRILTFDAEGNTTVYATR